ncbi:biotin/lipoyl-binding protein [Palleniella muris]|uniref:Biotin/lipoyl-binding protein n=1 Tax=Palleniella muris TaxID=3038145 RepID=A0AC61QPD5_9BACT|nr:biotin/lipoyl-containing protein [Palleniella muris]TGX81713.1 biotin/lipoyl-binding protein [Palleniella muris]
MMEFKYTINGNKYEVAVGTVEGDNVEVTVNGETYNVELEPKPQPKPRPVVKAPEPKAAPKAEHEGPNLQDALKAPLPGTIIDVLVKEGDEVKENQPLVILEAMKMNNNLVAERDGKVAQILVEAGEAVMENTPLVAFE